MLSKNDMVLIRGVLQDVLAGDIPALVHSVIQKTVPGMIEANTHILQREIRDEIHSTVKASEAGLIRRMDEVEAQLNKRMDAGFETILEVIDDDILPDLKTHERDIYTIKRHLKLA